MTKGHQIIYCYIFHALLILLGLLLLSHYVDSFLFSVAVVYGVYLVFCIILNRKSYVPWTLLLHHAIGFAFEFFLHHTEVIPPDSGFFGGLGQIIYIWSMLPYLALLALINLILFIIYKARGKQSLQ